MPNYSELVTPSRSNETDSLGRKIGVWVRYYTKKNNRIHYKTKYTINALGLSTAVWSASFSLDGKLQELYFLNPSFSDLMHEMTPESYFGITDQKEPKKIKLR